MCDIPDAPQLHWQWLTHHSDFKQSSWNLVCGILCLKPNTKQNFSSFWTSSFWVMANFPWFFGHFEDSFLLSLFLWFFPHIWPYLWNYWSDWTEIFCESRFWPSGGTHQISAFKVEGCRRYWVVRLTCKWCGWAATLCNKRIWKIFGDEKLI